MLRQSLLMGIMLAFLLVLTACPHKEIVGHEAALEPKSNTIEQQESPEQNNSIIGKWEALEPKSGLVNMLEFAPDGKGKSSLLARIYMFYQVEGEKLILTPDNGKSDDQGNKPIIYTYILENDRLKVTHDESGEVMDMWREDQATEPVSIVGRWAYKHKTGETARMIFDDNGVNIMRVPLPAGVESTYELQGDAITVTSIDKKHTQTANYKLEDGKLMLTDNKKTSYYIRLIDSK